MTWIPSLKRLLVFIFLSAAFTAIADIVHWNPARGYWPFGYPGESAATIESHTTSLNFNSASLPEPSQEFTFSFRARNLHNVPGKRYIYTDSTGTKHHCSQPGWSIMALSPDNSGILFRISTTEGNFDAVSSQAVMLIEVMSFPEMIKLAQKEVGEDVDFHTGFNSFRLARQGSEWKLYGGNRRHKLLTDISHDCPQTFQIGFSPEAGGLLEVAYLTLETPNQKYKESSDWPWYSTEKLDKCLNGSDDPMEGYWRVYDRETEESKLKMGGDYMIAIISDGNGGYDIVYLEGASVCSDSWHTGMKKGKLRPLPFKDIYEVEWIDAEHQPITGDVRAQRLDNNLLEIKFPYYFSTIRLGRIQ